MRSIEFSQYGGTGRSCDVCPDYEAAMNTAKDLLSNEEDGYCCFVTLFLVQTSAFWSYKSDTIEYTFHFKAEAT